MENKNLQARNWCYTLNNYTDIEYNKLAEITCRYHVYGKEVGENGTPHIQGYIEFDFGKRLASLKKIIPRAHFEMRRGTREQAAKYCKKDGNFKEIGNLSKQGERTDIQSVKEIAAKKGMRGVLEKDTDLNHIKIAETYLKYHEKPRCWEPKVFWIHGPTGTGKSRMARILCDPNNTYTKNEGSKWWDGYDNHEYVIIDDFRPSWWSLTEMLSLLDRYEKRIEHKGGHRQFRPLQIVVTSCLPPNECYTNTGEAIEQLMRRITCRINLTESRNKNINGLIGHARTAFMNRNRKVADIDIVKKDEQDSQNANSNSRKLIYNQPHTTSVTATPATLRVPKIFIDNHVIEYARNKLAEALRLIYVCRSKDFIYCKILATEVGGNTVNPDCRNPYQELKINN